LSAFFPSGPVSNHQLACCHLATVVTSRTAKRRGDCHHKLARLMEENPTLLRLKELETLEKVTEKIGNLTVYDGLEGVLKNMVPRLS